MLFGVDTKHINTTAPHKNEQFAPENRPKPNREAGSSSNHQFSGARC